MLCSVMEFALPGLVGGSIGVRSGRVYVVTTYRA